MLTKDLFNKLTNINNLEDNNRLELEKEGYLQQGKLSNKALTLLEPFKVKKALIIAAGFGSRMVPVTLSTPKPLVKVNGKRIIETLLDALIQQDIKDITIVRGYKKEQFDELLIKYPFLKFIDNDDYNKANNISSAYLISEYIDNAYICEADLLLSNYNIIKKYQYQSNYLGFKVNESNDWVFKTNSNLKIESVRIGGSDCYQMVGISYWTKEDGLKLKEDIKDFYINKKEVNKYWDEVALTYYKDNYNIYLRECNSRDIIEIDTYDELKAIDSSYK